MNILDLAKRTLALAEKATPGPWVSADDGGWLNANNKAVVESPWDNADDLAFIAHTRTAAPQLADAVVEIMELLRWYAGDCDGQEQVGYEARALLARLEGE